MKSRIRLFSICIALAAGCGGIPDSTAIAELSADEATMLCEETLAVAVPNPTPEQICTVGALIAGTADQAACEAARDMCLMDPPTTGEDVDCATAIADLPAGCTATVGDLRSCADASRALADHVYGRADCALAGTPDAPTVEDLDVNDAGCDAITACDTEG